MILGMSNGVAVDLDPSELRTHAVVVGPTGCGKTGLTTVICEEWDGPLLVLDQKGEFAGGRDPRRLDVLPSDPGAVLRGLGCWSAAAEVFVRSCCSGPPSGWVGTLLRPPRTVGGVPSGVLMPKGSREKLVRAISGLKNGWERLGFQDRQVLNMRGLGLDEQVQLTALLLGQVIEVARAGGLTRPLLLVVDEARGLIPPVKAPPTRWGLETILAQGRAWGLCLMLGSQHPLDLDHRALSNVGTWMIGPLKEKDLARDFPHGSAAVGLGHRQFCLVQGRGMRRFSVRESRTPLVGPRSVEEEVRMVVREEVKSISAAEQIARGVRDVNVEISRGFAELRRWWDAVPG